MSATAPLRYVVTPIDPAGHYFEVSCTLPDPKVQGQRFSLPAWIPGSYMIREFARNVVEISASSDNAPVKLTKIDKHTWRAGRVPAGQPLTVTARIYAWDLSVRAAHLDETHGFFNGTSLFLLPEGHADRPCQVELRRPAGEAYAAWRVATTLPRAKDAANGAEPYGFGGYEAANYDELVDHPVEMGTFTLATFTAGGAPHDIAITGRHAMSAADLDRLCADLARVCQWQIDLFGGAPGSAAPVERYLFLVMAVGDGYGGLEHRASTALIASRDDLPHGVPATGALPEGYLRFLGLCSHEYFHTWNVKRIKPAAFTPYDLAVENYTRLLWAFEGFTSYYDDLALVKSGLIDQAAYLALAAKNLTQVQKGPGRLRQSVAESSFDAWIKYYRPDENSANAVVSYYAKGAAIALGLDLKLRQTSGGAASLDDVMRLLWRRHGQTGVGVAEDGIFAAVAEVGGTGVARWLRARVEAAEELDLAPLFKGMGVELTWDAPAKAPILGIKLESGTATGEAKIAAVYADGPAHAVGLSAGDTLVAWNGLRVTGANLDKHLARHRAGDTVALHLFRRDELLEKTITLAAPAADTAQLKPARRAAPLAHLRRADWLGATPPTAETAA